MAEPWLWPLISGLFILGFAFFAFALGVLDAKGTALAFALGIAVALATHLLWVLVLVFFSLLGFLVTKLGYARKRALGVAEERGGTRGWRNVFANGVPPTLIALTALWLPRDAVALAFLTAVAAAAGDKFASELGVLSRERVVLITDWQREVTPGTNGGVTRFGLLMSLVGAGAAALVGALVLGLSFGLAWIPALLGFLGAQLDSVLGALWEAPAGTRGRGLTKNDVNFVSVAVPGFLVLAAAMLF